MRLAHPSSTGSAFKCQDTPFTPLIMNANNRNYQQYLQLLRIQADFTFIFPCLNQMFTPKCNLFVVIYWIINTFVCGYLLFFK